jgi:hypothetical protein
MPQDQQFDILGAAVTGELDQHLQDLTQQLIDQRRTHDLGSSLPPTAEPTQNRTSPSPNRLYEPHSCSIRQDRRLLDAATNPDLKSFVELLAHLPGDSEAAWFTKATDPDMTAGLEPEAAARALTGRWFYTLPGPRCGGGDGAGSGVAGRG